MSIHLHIDGLRGDSADARHQGDIDVIQLAWGCRRRITARASTRYDRESASAELQKLTFTKHMDRATPLLFIESCCGRGRTMTLELCRTGTGSGSEPYARYTLHHALLSDYHMAGWSEDEERPLEKIKISFSKLEVAYMPHDDDNNPLPPIVVGFDARTNERM
ncbi:type VI secretion system tube protein Hcp [Aquisalimonas lutea]|uniref:Hcp family type VI secretion system effector n=1 Tax=Aquisalimonas lutea TaxID=1327750 RepID=UPI0025B3FD05|nr:type VI secretion system tube protein Hcp [Aquisalimonas lutea]MDN3518506.1 type VI secretion system tube protein Hcp [Aquisalimonas lutea]